ncbi:MAG TPA: heme exporter protein CcmB [Candidatus Thermoplasmatota archaeon]|nr:heme exporter protein CcmB [Candidatus Thermoplasmatota archaeon]
MTPAWVRLALKDLRLEWRSRELMNTLLVLSLALITVGELSFHDLDESTIVAAGLLWLSFAFTSSLGLARSFTAEHDRGTLETLLLLPVPRGALFFGKVAATSLLLLLLQAMNLALIVLLFGIPLSLATALALAPVLLLATLGVASAGVLLGAVAAQTKGREVMGPVLLFPVLLPALIAGVHATIEILNGAPLHHVGTQLALLFGYDLAFLAVAWLLFEYAVEP